MGTTPVTRSTGSAYARWFSVVVWLGIVSNLLFVAAQVFAPDYIKVSLGVPVGTSTVWNVAHGMMVLARGATPKSVIQPSFQRVTDFLLTLQPAVYPFPIDKAAVERGRPIFARACADCHAFGGKRTGQVEEIAAIGTDRHRLDSFSAAVDRVHAINSRPFVFDAYRKTDGYANVPLNGIWARAPYLHNGSVPNMRAMLMPENERPVTFYRGYDVYNPEQVGFVSQGPEAERVGFLLDANIPGNSNKGHAYGVNLSGAQNGDLIEFLKTL